MSINIVFRIAAIGILVAMLNMLLRRSGHDEIAMVTTLAGLGLVLYMMLDIISQLFQSVKTLFTLY